MTVSYRCTRCATVYDDLLVSAKCCRQVFIVYATTKRGDKFALHAFFKRDKAEAYVAKATKPEPTSGLSPADWMNTKLSIDSLEIEE